MILNLTRHPATEEQRNAGVVDVADEDQPILEDLLTFETDGKPGDVPQAGEIQAAADALARLAEQYGASAAMIGGAPFLMHPLHVALEEEGVRPVYAFSLRVSAEEKIPTGGVRKTQDFTHLGFVGLIADSSLQGG